MAEIAEVADAHIVDLDQVDGVAASLGALLGVMKCLEADDAHASDLVLAWPLDLVRPVTHGLGVAVVLVLVADGQEVRLLPGQAEADAGRVRIGHDSRALAAQPEAAVS